MVCGMAIASLCKSSGLDSLAALCRILGHLLPLLLECWLTPVSLLGCLGHDGVDTSWDAQGFVDGALLDVGMELPDDGVTVVMFVSLHVVWWQVAKGIHTHHQRLVDGRQPTS